MQHAMQQQHFGAPPSYLNGSHIKSENGSERGVSPHPSDSSRYSSQQPQQQLPSYPSIPQQHMNGLRYPSPSQMQAPMPMLNNSNYIPTPQTTHTPSNNSCQMLKSATSTMAGALHLTRVHPRLSHARPVVKASRDAVTLHVMNVSTAVSALTCATTPTAVSSSSSAPL
ncbi:hypothetical protein P3342_000186 [Pyrenophora teres f. teres]|nr:hypothetical protein P3342_000186 [Pyrenophora teres f. teres]